MFRRSTDAEYLDSGKVVIDADGIAVEIASVDDLDAKFESRSPRVLAYSGTGDPALSDFPDARVGDVIERISDGSKWRVDEQGLTSISQPPVLRVDTSVGTRVFAGDVMVYGDTGWRDMSQYLTPGMSLSSSFGRARMRRIGSRVEFDVKLDVTQAGIVSIFQGIPRGLWPIGNFPMDGQIFTASTQGAGASALKSGAHAGVFYDNNTPMQTGSATPWPSPGTVAWTSSYATGDPWLTSLPGTPA